MRARPRPLVAWPGALLTVLLAVLVGGVLLAPAAGAHAVLESSDPAADAVVATLPGQVRLSFSESVTLVPESLRVYAPDGSRADRGDVEHGAHDSDIEVSLDDGTHAQQGTYLVSWRVISADSHPVSGAFTFSVGKASVPPVAPIAASSRLLGSALGVARWSGYLGSALLIGGLIVLGWCWRAGWALRRVRWLLALGGVLIALGAVGDLLLKGPYDAALGLGATFHGDLVGEVLGTTYGHATLARLVLALLGLLLVWRRVRSLRVAAVLAVALGVTYALAGHAAVGSDHVSATVNDTVHVIAASVWLGGLILLSAAVLPILRRTDGDGDVTSGEGAEAARLALTRFSDLAGVVVLVVAATGLFQAIRQVDSLGALTGTAYGAELLVKVALVVVLVALAAFSRRWVRHGISDGGLHAFVAAEAVLLGVVLGVSSALVATEPAKTAYHPITSASLTLVGRTVDITTVPDGERRAQVHLYVLDPDGQPGRPKQLTASLSLPSQGIDALPVPLTQADPGHWQGEVAVPVGGDWRLAVTLRTTAIDEATGYAEVQLR